MANYALCISVLRHEFAALDPVPTMHFVRPRSQEDTTAVTPDRHLHMEADGYVPIVAVVDGVDDDRMQKISRC